MRTINVTELRRNLFSTLERVRAGEIVVIERNGKPVARLVPENSGKWQQQMKQKIRVQCPFEELVAPMDDVWGEYV